MMIRKGKEKNSSPYSKTRNDINSKELAMTAGCSLLTGLIVFGFFLIRSHGFFTVLDDFNIQQIPFYAGAWEAIHSGTGEWFWGLDLGSSFVNGFSFYNLGSPFFWIYLLLPKESLPWLMGVLYIVKYMTASITAYLFLSYMTKSRYSVVGALIYAFSGFQTTNLMFFHFHDAVAFFPLMLLGAEKSIREEKRILLILAVLINCLINYFFFIQEAVFLGLYYCFRSEFRIREKSFWKSGLAILFSGILGVGLAAGLFYPSILYVLGSDRSGPGFNLSLLSFDTQNLLRILKGMILPGDTMKAASAVVQDNWDSASCYLPLFGLAYVIAYCRKENGWLKRFIVFLAVISFIPLAQAGFLLFTAVYQRWWFMMTLMMSLATVRVLERPSEYPVKSSAAWNLGIVTVFYLAVRYMNWDGSGVTLENDRERFFVLSSIAAGSALLLFFIHKIRRGKYPLTLILTMGCCVITTAVTLAAYRGIEASYKGRDTENMFEAGMKLHNMDEQYRFASTDNLAMIPNNTGGTASFTSTAELSSYEFSDLFDQYSTNHLSSRTMVPYVSELSGGKYILSGSADPDTAVEAVPVRSGYYYILEQSACPIGFSVKNYISEHNLRSLPAEERALVLMNAACLGDAEIEKLTGGIAPADVSEMDLTQPENVIARTVENRVLNFKRTNEGFSCETDWEDQRYVYFSVPFDPGWRALTDGQETVILPSGGMMVIHVPEGPHEIRFIYRTPGLREGGMLSLAALAVFILYCMILTRKRTSRGRKRIPAKVQQ